MDDTQVTTVIKNDLSWLQRHERIIIVALILAAGVYSVNKWINYKAGAAQTAYQVAAAQLAQSRQDAITATSQYQAALTLAQRQNAALAAAISSRQTVLVQQQETIKTLPLPEVGQGIQTAIGGTGDITAEVDGLRLDDSAARRTLSLLVEVPVLKADKVDLQTELTNSETALSKAGDALAKDEALIAQDDKTCKLQVASVKADANKSKKKWFVIGYVAGLATRGAIKLLTGL